MTQYLLQVSVVYCVWCYVRHDVASILCVKINLPGDEAVPAASECRVLCVVLCVVCTVCMVYMVCTVCTVCMVALPYLCGTKQGLKGRQFWMGRTLNTLKVEAAAWLEDGFCVCDQCPGENEHVQNEVDAL